MATENPDYLNKKRHWPHKDKWEQLCDGEDVPPDEKRCQKEIGRSDEPCGLPKYTTEEGEARCVFHCSDMTEDAKRERQQLLQQIIRQKSDAEDVGEITCLWHANLDALDLRRKDLTEMRLGHAHLRGTKLQFANLGTANLKEADLFNAYLNDVILSGACLDRANLKKAKLRRW